MANSPGYELDLIDWSSQLRDGKLHLLDREDLVSDTLTVNDLSQVLPMKRSASYTMEKASAVSAMVPFLRSLMDSNRAKGTPFPTSLMGVLPPVLGQNSSIQSRLAFPFVSPKVSQQVRYPPKNSGRMS